MTRKTPAHIRLTLFVLSAALATATYGNTAVSVGSEAVDGKRLGAYEAKWTQKRLQEGTWIDGGMLHEKAVVGVEDGRSVLRHTQTMPGPGGGTVVAKMVFDHTTLAPRSLVQSIENGPPQMPTEIRYTFGAAQIEGQAKLGDKTKDFAIATEQPMFYGMTFGLVLATLPLEAGYKATLPASMPQMQATYKVEIEVVGQETYTAADGSEAKAWVVDTAWIDLASGDVSPGGADQSGGAYVVIPDPPKGLPYVPKYVNDTFVIELAD